MQCDACHSVIRPLSVGYLVLEPPGVPIKIVYCTECVLKSAADAMVAQEIVTAALQTVKGQLETGTYREGERQ